MFTLLTAVAVYLEIVNTAGQINTEKGNTISWTIKYSPIVFGNDAVLFCNLSAIENCCANTVTWMKDHDVILHHGASTDISKYQQIKENDGFSIVIKHFDEQDLDCQYTCYYEFHSYSKTLNINLHDFELRPTNKTIESTIIASSSQLVVVLNFAKVFPSPQCQILMNEIILPSERLANETRSGLFLSSRVKLVCDLQYDSCFGNVSVWCLVGRTKILINESDNMNLCEDSDTPLTSSESNTKEVAIGVPTALIVIFIIAAVTIKLRRKTHLKSYTSVNKEDSVGYLYSKRQKNLQHITKFETETDAINMLLTATNSKINAARLSTCK